MCCTYVIIHVTDDHFYVFTPSKFVTGSTEQT